jgi:integrase
MVGSIVRTCIRTRDDLMPAYRDPSGRWRYRKWITLPSGTRERITGTPATDRKDAAERAEREHIDRVMNPDRVQPAQAAAPQRKDAPTLKEFSERFLAEYLPRQKPSSRYAKERILKGRGGLIAYFGAMYLDEIDQSHVNSYVATLGNLATKTVNEKLTVLSTLLGYAGPKGCKLIPESVLSMHIDGMAAEIVSVPSADVAKLIAACTDDRYKVAVLLASEAGLRIGEIRGVQWTDIKDGRITIRGAIDQRNNVTPPKHDRSRIVPLSPALVSALGKLQRRGIWIVSRLDDGGSLTYWALWEAIRTLYTRAGVAIPVSESLSRSCES